MLGTSDAAVSRIHPIHLLTGCSGRPPRAFRELGAGCAGRVSSCVQLLPAGMSQGTLGKGNQ